MGPRCSPGLKCRNRYRSSTGTTGAPAENAPRRKRSRQGRGLVVASGAIMTRGYLRRRGQAGAGALARQAWRCGREAGQAAPHCCLCWGRPGTGTPAWQPAGPSPSLPSCGWGPPRACCRRRVPAAASGRRPRLPPGSHLPAGPPPALPPDLLSAARSRIAAMGSACRVNRLARSRVPRRSTKIDCAGQRGGGGGVGAGGHPRHPDRRHLTGPAPPAL